MTSRHPMPLHLPPSLVDAAADIPGHILACMGLGASAVIALGSGAVSFFTGQVPTVSEANGWPFYGVLIVAIIVLFATLARVVWWGATKLLDALNRNTDALNRVDDTIKRQVEYYEDLGTQAIKSALTTPPVPTPAFPARQPRPPREQ